MSVIPLPRDRSLASALGHLAWRSLQVAAAVLVVVVPFGYATTAVHNHVLMGVGSGIAVGVGLNLRMGEHGRSTSILIGSALGVVMALIGGGQDFVLGPGIYIPPVLGLGVGLIDGLGTQRVQTYRDACIESLVLCVPLALGVTPSLGLVGFATALLLMPTMALIAGFVSRDATGRRYSRPPAWLLAGTLGASIALVAAERLFTETPSPAVVLVGTLALVQFTIPAVTFLSGRAAAGWLEPRLRVYAQLAEYLRVMWIPIGGFAAGYLAIILVFAGFCGMLERFAPGSFVGAAGTGIGDWVSFSFFSALAQDYTGITPATVPARMLVGIRLLLSVGWALVVFAAVMSSIQPQLDRIARRDSNREPRGVSTEPRRRRLGASDVRSIAALQDAAHDRSSTHPAAGVGRRRRTGGVHLDIDSANHQDAKDENDTHAGR